MQISNIEETLGPYKERYEILFNREGGPGSERVRWLEKEINKLTKQLQAKKLSCQLIGLALPRPKDPKPPKPIPVAASKPPKPPLIKRSPYGPRRTTSK
jgi:hypothetical protein